MPGWCWIINQWNMLLYCSINLCNITYWCIGFIMWVWPRKRKLLRVCRRHLFCLTLCSKALFYRSYLSSINLENVTQITGWLFIETIGHKQWNPSGCEYFNKFNCILTIFSYYIFFIEYMDALTFLHHNVNADIPINGQRTLKDYQSH